VTLSKYTLSILSVFFFVGCGEVTTSDNNDSTIPSIVLGERLEHQEENTTIPPMRPTMEVEEPIEEEIPQETPPTPTESPIIIQEEPIPQPSPPPVVIEPIVHQETYTEKFINDNRCDQILDKVFLVICYDYQLKVARAVSYTLAGDLVYELNIQDRPNFYVEGSIDAPYRATLADYRGSGYDRGHLAPDASFDWSQESLDATYSLANIIPQVPVVNQQMWVDAENYERSKAFDLGELHVLNLIRYKESNNTTIGEGNITVSIGYYKILYNQDEAYEECFYYANNLDANSTNDTLLSHSVACQSIL
jgi:endonuclease G